MSLTVSIITVVRNAKATIGQALASVAAQDYPQVEHWVLDGESTDGTKQVIESFAQEHPEVRWRSKADKGMYHALNQGIELASGQIIGFLHADDFFANPHVISSVVAAFKQGVDAVYGDLVYVDAQDTSSIKRYWQAGNFKPGTFIKGWHPPHTALFLRRDVYQRYGDFDTSFPIGNDVELMMRLFEKHRIRSVYLPQVLVHMRTGGISNRSFKNILAQNQTIMRAFKQNDLKVSWPYFIVNKGLNRFKQYVRKPKRVKDVV